MLYREGSENVFLGWLTQVDGMGDLGKWMKGGNEECLLCGVELFGYTEPSSLISFLLITSKRARRGKWHIYSVVAAILFLH